MIKTETVERFVASFCFHDGPCIFFSFFHFRCWHSQTESLGYLFCQPRLPSQLPYLWTCTFFSSLKQSGKTVCVWVIVGVIFSDYGGVGVCLVTMVMCPLPGVCVAPLLTGQLCALREHITMRNFKVYSRYQLKSSKVQLGLGEDRGKNGKEASVQAREDGRDADATKHITTTSSAAFNKESSTSSFPSSDTSFMLEESVSFVPQQRCEVDARPPQQSSPLSHEEVLNQRYLSMAEECTNRLVSMAGQGTGEGWLEVGTTKNVHVMKKLPANNEPPINSVKGTGIVDAPPEFLLRILQDPAHTTTLDDLLKETRVVQKLSPAVTLVHLLYKPVWPTSPRDFAVLSVAGQVNATTWVSSGSSIEDSRIPLEKGYVRADLLGGGYVICSLPNKPNQSVVTYAACVNLKGSIPAFAVNKIAESQPMCVNNLRKLAEPLYKKMVADPQAMDEFQAQFPISQAFTKPAESAPQVSPAAADTPPPPPPDGEKAAAGPLLSPTSQPPDTPPSTNAPVLAPLLQDKLAQSQWHFDPSLLPQDNPSARPDSQDILNSCPDPQDSLTEAKTKDDVHYRFQTPPIESDHDDTDSKPTDTAATGQFADLAPPSVSRMSRTSSDRSQESNSAPNTPSQEHRSRGSSSSSHAALQLSQYTPSNGHLPSQDVSVS